MRRLPPYAFCDGRVEHAHAGAPDVRTGAVAFDERNDRVVRHDELTVLARDRRTACGRFERGKIRHMFLGQVTCVRGRFPRTLWKTLWKRHHVYAVVMQTSECFSGLHHEQGEPTVALAPATKTLGLYLAARWRVEHAVSVCFAILLAISFIASASAGIGAAAAQQIQREGRRADHHREPREPEIRCRQVRRRFAPGKPCTTSCARRATAILAKATARWAKS